MNFRMATRRVIFLVKYLHYGTVHSAIFLYCIAIKLYFDNLGI